MILVFEHRQCLVGIPITKSITATDNPQLLTNTELGSANLQAYRALVLCCGAQLALVNHDTVCQCRAIHIGIFRDVNPVVIHRIAHSLLSGKLQTMRLNEPFVAHLFVATHHAVIIVDIGAWLGHLINLHKPVIAVKCRHLVLRHLGIVLCRANIQYQVLTEGRLVFYIK